GLCRRLALGLLRASDIDSPSSRRLAGSPATEIKMIRLNRTHVASLLCGLGLVSCGGAAESTADTSEPVINGTPVATDNIGTPVLSISNAPNPPNPSQSWGCSGTMLNSTWVLTAHHCVTINNLTTGGTIIPPGTLTASLLNAPPNTQVTAV